MDKNKQILMILLIISVGTTIGVWYYQDSQLKDMEELLRIAGEEYSTLDRMYAELDLTYKILYSEFTYISEEFNDLYKIHTDLEDSIPGIIEDSILLGYNEGEEVGYEQGTIDGEIAGYESGYNIGSEDGYSNGLTIGHNEGYLVGYDVGYDWGVADGIEAHAMGDYDGIYWFLRDPTYKEVREFIIRDHTDRMVYQDNIFTCADFSYIFKTNAYEEGYRCFGVYIEFDGTAHLIVGFNTTDQGMVYIDPQNDYFVELEVGIDYWNTALQSPHDYIGEFIITRWNIHW